MNSKAVVLGAVLLAGMGALAVFYNLDPDSDSMEGEGSSGNKLHFDGRSFMSTVTADDGSVATVWSDYTTKSQRIDSVEGGTRTTFLVLDGQAYDITHTTVEADGQTFEFYTQCAEGESDIAIWAEEQFNDEAMAEAAASVEEEYSEGDLEGLAMEIDGEELIMHVEDGKVTGIKYGDDSAALSSVSFEPINPSVFALPGACTGDNEENSQAIAAYVQAFGKHSRRQLRAIEEADNWPEDERTPSESVIEARRALMVKHTAHNRKMWAGAVDAAVDFVEDNILAPVLQVINEEASINMFNNRYAGPDQEGCAPEDRWTAGEDNYCGGPVSESDACTTYHDHGCGANVGSKFGVAQPGTRGANAGAQEGGRRGVGCLYGPHSDFTKAEHCSCTGTLNKCAWEARAHTTCFNGQTDCRAEWTGTKVSAAFAIFPCWYQNTETYQCNCRTRYPGCNGCGWRGCNCWGFSRTCSTCTRVASHCPMGPTSAAHAFWDSGSKCCAEKSTRGTTDGQGDGDGPWFSKTGTSTRPSCDGGNTGACH